jgi:hypothetical protein
VADKGSGTHSLFVRELVKEMRAPDLTIEEVFNRARVAVLRQSGGQQTPWISSSLTEEWRLGSRSQMVAEVPSHQPKPPPLLPSQPQPELADLFPWPPPTPSTRRSFSADIRADLPPATSVGDVAARLEDRLRGADFDTWGYFRTPGGFALVARAERLDPHTGTPLAGRERWSDQLSAAGITLGSIFAWSRPRGLYRTFVFILTDDPPMSRPLGPTETRELLGRWALTGRTSLPVSVQAEPLGAGHQLVVLVYEFEKAADGETAHNVPSRWSLDHHIETLRMSLKALR